jgi:hypothetical protein
VLISESKNLSLPNYDNMFLQIENKVTKKNLLSHKIALEKLKMKILKKKNLKKRTLKNKSLKNRN